MDLLYTYGPIDQALDFQASVSEPHSAEESKVGCNWKSKET